MDAVGLKKTAIYALIRTGDFPAPVALTSRSVAWRSDDVDRWIESRAKVADTSPHGRRESCASDAAGV
ncbi:helix-turn-helix transcriptional regulator [Ralstonia insidiosa]|uniref:helix-turn-helix transcriptional regulator n=2 Tax=Ralstonia TaxID=48736 RepID=UPI001F36FAC0|nr:AlpA family phage regulatory protein [Ralstonia insidiosa]